MVGFAGALGQVFDLHVLDGDLLAQERVLPFQSRGIARHRFRFGRGLPRLVGARRGESHFRRRRGFLLRHRRDWPRFVAAGQGLSRLFDVGDVLRNRCGRDQILLAVGDFNAPAIEMAIAAIALNSARRARQAGAFIERDSILDREGIVVGACRGRPRLVVPTHSVPLALRTARRLSPSWSTLTCPVPGSENRRMALSGLQPGSRDYTRAIIAAQMSAQIGAFALPALLPGYIARWDLSNTE